MQTDREVGRKNSIIKLSHQETELILPFISVLHEPNDGEKGYFKKIADLDCIILSQTCGNTTQI